MRAFILLGSVDLKENYIQKYIVEKGLKPYNVLRYSEPLKISEVRQIKKNLSSSPIGGGGRLLIIDMEPTIEAQNALLKTLEELTAETDIFFCGGENLLPTVVSRCIYVRLGKGEKKSMDRIHTQALLDDNHNFPQKVILLDQFFSGDAKIDFQNMVLSLRENMLESVRSKDYKLAYSSYTKLKDLTNYSHFIFDNNLNSRYIAERVFA
ncbi:MAG: hypothetical protein A2776_00985 [Candidatus Levybacteria bacterium RIFCSPHIGHO2_01_FULL_40_10]|nr:MAG: hypothetical protein A2776_00985 [Candidatus Levybacteria bacterium RIFCSPHIGHO2_01_FULL_40_10]